MVSYRVLGPLEIRDTSGTTSERVSPRFEPLLRLLVLRADEWVSAEDLRLVLGKRDRQLHKGLTEIRQKIGRAAGDRGRVTRLDRDEQRVQPRYRLRLLEGDSFDWRTTCDLVKDAKQQLKEDAHERALELALEALANLGNEADPLESLEDVEILEELRGAAEELRYDARRVVAIARAELGRDYATIDRELEDLIGDDRNPPNSRVTTFDDRLWKALLRVRRENDGRSAAEALCARREARDWAAGQELRAALRELTRKRTARTSTAKTTAPPQTPPPPGSEGASDATGPTQAAVLDRTARTRSVLIVEDDPGFGEDLREVLEMDGCVCTLATKSGDAIRILKNPEQYAVNFAAVDLHLRELDHGGLVVLRYLRAYRPEVPRVLMTALPDDITSWDDYRTNYGLLDILPKKGDVLERLREKVEKFLSPDEDAARKLALARFDSSSTYFRQELTKRAQRASGRVREGLPGAERARQMWEERTATFRASAADLRHRLNDEAETDLDGLVEKFEEEWRGHLESW